MQYSVQIEVRTDLMLKVTRFKHYSFSVSLLFSLAFGAKCTWSLVRSAWGANSVGQHDLGYSETVREREEKGKGLDGQFVFRPLFIQEIADDDTAKEEWVWSIDNAFEWSQSWTLIKLDLIFSLWSIFVFIQIGPLSVSWREKFQYEDIEASVHSAVKAWFESAVIQNQKWILPLHRAYISLPRKMPDVLTIEGGREREPLSERHHWLLS